MRLVAFQGVAGAFSHEVALAHLRDCRGADAPRTTTEGVLPCEQFEDVFDAVRDGRADRGVVPVENTLAGSVQRAYDLLRERRLTIVGEEVRRIRHSLLAPPGTRLADVRRVLSHPVALAQCRRFFQDNPAVRAVAVADTAGAVAELLEAGDSARVRDAAAIASRSAAAIYGAAVLADGLEDDPHNYTRFLIVARPGTAPTRAHGPHHAMKTSLWLTLPNRPGSLVRALRHIAERGVDLAMIESRPIAGRPWEYAFCLDLAGAIDDHPVAEAIGSMRADAQSLQVLGSYPRAVGPDQLGRAGRVA